MQSKPKKELFRIVRTEQNDAIFDATGKLNGRGLYICSMDCLKKAIKTNRIEKIFEMKVSEDSIDRLLADIDAYTK